MSDTIFVLDPGQQPRLAEGHAGDQPLFLRRHTPMKAWDMGEVMRGVGGMYSTVNDLLVFARANLGMLRHSLNPLLAATHQVQARSPHEEVALGWLLDRVQDEPVTIVFKFGVVSGYTAYLGFVPEASVGVAVLCNTFNWEDKMGHNLIVRLAGALGPASNKQLAGP